MPLSKWSKRFLDMADLVASWSKDPSTKVGCVIARGNRVISLGFNGYPSGIQDVDDPRDLKYSKTIHAEVNAILHANVSLSGCDLYVTPLHPCSRCAAIIVQSNIQKVYVRAKRGNTFSRWQQEFKIASKIFEEAGIQVYLEIA